MTEPRCRYCRLLGVPTAPLVRCPQCHRLGALVVRRLATDGGVFLDVKTVDHGPILVGTELARIACVIDATGSTG